MKGFMHKDKANIFKLSNDLSQYNDHEFDDCMPGAKEFAECLKCSILTKETPYVLLLEDKFGMGKTHFSTRFVHFLRNSSIDTIYFSAWENDYIESPFISISKEMIKYFNSKKSLFEEFQSTIKAICELTWNITKHIKVPIGIPLDIDQAFSAGKQFIDNFIERDDYLLAFKKELQKFINHSLNNHKLVIIVDELDRCRPDYAMKTLEIIKHFFDIEGLFIIIPTNKRSLENCVKALYGIDDSIKSSEYELYFNKFFTDEISLYTPNYLKLVQEYINDTTVRIFLESNKMVLCDRYNALNVLQDKIAEFAQGFKLSLREVVNVCHKAIYYTRYIEKRLDCEYLAFLLCSKIARIENINCKIQTEHPFSTTSKKKELLKFIVPEEVYTIGNIIYEQDFFNDVEFFRNRNFNSYKEFDEFYNYFIKKPKTFDAYRSVQKQFIRLTHSYSFLPLMDYIENKKRLIDDYRDKWDSDDNDKNLQEYYQNIVKNEASLHNEKLSLNNL